MRLYGAQEKVLERYFKKLEEAAAMVSQQRWGTRKQLVVFFGSAGITTRRGWGAKAVLQACRKVVERPNSGKPTDRVPGKVVTVDEFRTSRVSSILNSPQPCEEELDRSKPTRLEGWKPQPGQVQHRLLQSAWSKRFEAPVRGLMWCPWLAQATPGKLGKWVDRDCNAALNLQRIGEAPWRPLELCRWQCRGAAPAKGKELRNHVQKLLQEAEAEEAGVRPGPMVEQQAMLAELIAVVQVKRSVDHLKKFSHICGGLPILFSMAKKKERTVPKLVPEDSDSDILDRDEALQPDLTEAQRNKKASREARATRDRDNTYHGRKCKLAHLTDHLPQELRDAFLADAVQPRVEACSERAVIGSLLLGFLVRGLFTIHVADPLALHGQPVYTDIPVSQAAIPDLSCRNLFLQQCRGLPGDGANTRPSAAVAAVLAAHPDLRARLAAIPRYHSDCNMVDHVEKQLETAFCNMRTLLFAGRLKKSMSLSGAKVLVGTNEHQRRFGFRGLGGGHLPARSKRQCTYVRRMVCGLDVSWLLKEGGVVPTAAMQAEVALQRGLVGLEEGERVDDDWLEDPANRGRLLRYRGRLLQFTPPEKWRQPWQPGSWICPEWKTSKLTASKADRYRAQPTDDSMTAQAVRDSLVTYQYDRQAKKTAAQVSSCIRNGVHLCRVQQLGHYFLSTAARVALQPVPDSEPEIFAADTDHEGHEAEVFVEETEPAIIAKGLYLVRIPRPPINEEDTKAPQAELQGYIAKLKPLNALITSKRDEVRGYRQQMNEARGLKDTSEPEYQEKLGRIKQLRDLRAEYVGKIQEIKSSLQGLDCNSEQELEDKIRELERKIQHEIKAIISDMDGEFGVIKSERDMANKIVQEIWVKLSKARDELKEIEAEHAELALAKEAAQRALDSAREETNSSMRSYRENRRFSLQVRDLVAAGQVEEARSLVASQVEEWVTTLTSDSTARKEYEQLWAEQRKYMVSVVLPGSSLSAQAEAKAAQKAAAAGKGAAARQAPAPPRGAEKAKSIIESLMAEASREAAVARLRNGGRAEGDSGDEEVPKQVQPVKKAEPYRPPQAPAAAATVPAPAAKLVSSDAAANAAAAAAFNFKVELPKIPDMEFELPAMAAPQPAVDAAAKQQALREEQRRLAAEAEERKRRRAEVAERKKQQAAEAAKKLEAERRERDAAARAAAVSSKAAAAAASTAQQAEQEAVAGDTVDASGSASEPANSKAVAKQGIPTPFEKSRMLAAAKRPKVKPTVPLLKQVQKLWQDWQGWIILVIVVLFCLMLAVMSSSSSKA
ncbi:hypothetical protein QJQ45_025615 [Haematococcus lacustris]|nr:hypothetical protein QJQ45_025615 [Haematococcus lacustris]